MKNKSFKFFYLIFKPNIFFFFFLVSIASICKTHFSERSIATGLVCFILARTIFIITIIGTDKSIHIIHQICHQNIKDKIITSGLKFNLFHINFGSTIFHIKSWSQVKNEIINNALFNSKFGWTKDKIAGKTTAKIEPIFGTKFNVKAKSHQKAGKFNQKDKVIK